MEEKEKKVYSNEIKVFQELYRKNERSPYDSNHIIES